LEARLSLNERFFGRKRFIFHSELLLLAIRRRPMHGKNQYGEHPAQAQETCP
jgi:hypothetical protein